MRNTNVKRRISTQFLAVAISLAVIAVLVWAARNTSRTASQLNVKAKSIEKLEKLRQKYATVGSVHIVADAQITFYGANPRSGAGSYEYWVAGDRYKMKVHSDGRLGMLGDRDVAYDGKRFYFFDHASGILSYQREDVPKTTGAISNPLFLPVDFLNMEDDNCRACGLRLADFKSRNDRWEHRSSHMEVKSQSRDERTGYELTDFEMPGGVEGKQPFKIHLRLANAASETARVIQIDRKALDGTLRSSFTFDNFVQSDLGDFPRTIKVEGFDGDSNLVARMIYTVKTLETNQPIDDRNFAVGFDEAPGVWDSDARRFVKERPDKPRRK